MQLDSQLQREREQRGWSRAMLAEALSTTVLTVEQWEQGIAEPSPYLQNALCTLFDLGAHDLGLPYYAKNAIADTDAFLLLPRRDSVPSLPIAYKTDHIYDPALPLLTKGYHELIGRDELLEHLKVQLKTQRLLALHGLPGVGKTALAIALAHDDEIRAEFSDGVLWAGLGHQAQFPAVLLRWGRLLGAIDSEWGPPRRSENWMQEVRNMLSTRRHLLLVLDDVWQAEIIEALQIEGCQCGYVITTRFAHIATSIAAERAVLVSELGERESLQLLTRLAPQIRQDEQDAIDALISAVQGLPLALSIMGKYLGAVAKQPRRLHAALQQLQTARQRLQLSAIQSPRTLSLPNQLEISVQSVLAVSDQHLPPAARQALRDLSLLPTKPTSVARDAAFAVTSAEMLDILSDAGLLEYPAPTRYSLHPVIADYARLQGHTPEAPQCLLHYAVTLLKTQSAAILEQESATLLAALDAAYEMGWREDLLQGILLLTTFLLQSGWYGQAEQVLQRATTAATDDPNGKTRLLKNLSTLFHQVGNYELARSCAHEGLALARKLGDQEQICSLLTALGVVALEQGDYPQAEEYYWEGLELARALNDEEQGGILLKNLGVVAKKRGDYAQAEALYQEALTLARRLQHTDLESRLLTNLGSVAHERGDYDRAEALYQQSLALARQLRQRERICVLLSNLGVVADAKSNYAQADRLLQEGLTVARQLGHRERTSLLLLNLGVTASRQGNDLQAESYYQESLTLARQLGHRERISLLLLNLGEVAMERGNDLQAESYYQESLTLARQLGHRERICDLLLHLGILATEQKRPKQANTWLTEGEDSAYKLEHTSLRCRLLLARGDLLLQQEELKNAASVLHTVLTMAPRGDQSLIAQVYYGLARVAVRSQQSDQARSYAEQSYSIFKTAGHRKRHVARALLDQLSKETGQETEEFSTYQKEQVPDEDAGLDTMHRQSLHDRNTKGNSI